MITIDELKAKLGGMKTAVDDLRDALSIEASEKRLAELEHQMTMPGFYDDQARSQKVISEMGEVKNKLERFGKLSTQYEEAETLLLMIEEENDPSLAAEGEEAVNGVEKSIDELQLMTMLNGEYDHNNAILTFHAGTGGTEAQDWAEMLYRMYTRWAEAHGYSVEVLDVLDFGKRITGADLIFTGEGRADRQTVMGKVPSGILEEARKQNIPVIVLAGSIEDAAQMNRAGFQGIFSITPGPVTMEKAMEPEFARENIRRLVTQICSVIHPFATR